MSLLRILFGVLIGVGLLAGIAVLCQHYPVAARYACAWLWALVSAGF